MALNISVSINISKEVLDWTDFEVVGEDDIDDGDAQAGAQITMPWSQTGNNLTVTINVQHTAIVESDTVRTAAMLQHEQGHLNLGILAARRMKRDVLAGISPNNALTTHLTRLGAANIAYDNSTNHGLNAQTQSAWNAAFTSAMAAAAAPASVNGTLL